jgi:uncharacterized membrane protein
MFFIHLVFALLVGLILTAIFALIVRAKGPWTSLLAVFVLIFLASWAGGVWLLPFGSPLWGTYWLPFLVVGLIFSLLLGALVSSSPSTVEVVEPQKEEARRKRAVLALGIFFWILVGVLIVAIIVHYL